MGPLPERRDSPAPTPPPEPGPAPAPSPEASAEPGPAPGPHPLVWGAVAAAVLSVWAGSSPSPSPGTASAPAGSAAAAAPQPARESPGVLAACGPRTIPEGDSCVPLPPAGARLDADGGIAPPALEARARAWDAYDQIPRLPDRPAELAEYRWPIGAEVAAPRLLVPGDDERPGFDLVAERGEEVRSVALEGQAGGAEVAFVGDLHGVTVVTSHRTGEAERERRYVLIHGHLDRPGPGVVAGAKVAPGDVIGLAGDTGTPGVVHLYVEARQVREGIDLAAVDLSRLADSSVTIACDARNVLPRRP